ncbi:MAG: hypothetical protein AAFS11_02015 [Planctomycetota bacterium]
MLLRFALVMCWSLTCSAQPEADDRRRALEERRELLEARLLEIEAELSGDVPAGTVRLFGRGDRFAGERIPPGFGGMQRDSTLLDENEREALLDDLAETDPQLAESIREIMRERRGFPAPMLGRLRDLSVLRERDPKGFSLRRQEIRAGLEVLRRANALRDVIRSGASEPAKDAAAEALREAVASGFDARSDVLRREIERTTKQVSGMRAKLDQAESNRDAIIEQQFTKLVSRIRAAADRDD